MTDWILIPCLKILFGEFDRIAPSRDRASDGSIGDAAHQAEVSDHNPDETGSVPIHDADHVNEVHAIDVDNTLNAGDLTMERTVQFLLGRCRSGAEKRLRYIIYNRRIWSASSGWVQKTYTGASPHTEHAHFSASYETALEADTSPWHLEDLVALSDDDKKWLVSLLNGGPGDVVPRWSDTGGAVEKTDSNPTQTPASALYYLGATARRIENGVTSLAAKVSGLPQDVIDVLVDAGRSDEDVAAALRAALGDRAAAVGALLAAA